MIKVYEIKIENNYVDNNVTNFTNYFYKVIAANEEGTSNDSQIVRALPNNSNPLNLQYEENAIHYSRLLIRFVNPIHYSISLITFFLDKPDISDSIPICLSCCKIFSFGYNSTGRKDVDFRPD